jgi:high-affinity iron transporter
VAWADAIPNFLIGLREGLEAGLVVSILLAALRKSPLVDGRRATSLPVWLGVLGAVSVAGSFAAVLTFSTSVLASAAQEAVGGLLSVFAVGLVTAMVFWMRRTAASLSRDLKGKVASAAQIGAGALAVTAFLAVGREGLETTLFLWTAVRASGQTVAPLVGAGVGIAAAIVLCWLLYRGAARVNLGVFFSRTAIGLIVIAAGIFAYGLGDLQDAGLLPGQTWLAFDISGTVAADSWWMSIITGVTELSPKMTVLQVVAWVAYLAVVLPMFVRAGRPARASATPPVPVPAPIPVEARPQKEPRFERWIRAAEKRVWVVAVGLVAVPALVAAAVIVALPADTSTDTAVTVSATSCGSGWSSGRTGQQTFTVTNSSSKAGEVDLDNAAGQVVAELETLGPATSADMTATLDPGTYTFKCYLSADAVTMSQPVQVTGASTSAIPAAITPVTVAELSGPNQAYQRYAATQLTALAAQLATIGNDLQRGDRGAAEADWLPAQQDWERVGASYDSFGDLGLAVDGLPDGYPGGVNGPHFTGLHRLEYGLWHDQGFAELEQVLAPLAKNVATVQRDLTSVDLTGDPTNLPIRAHEVLEDALRDHLSGVDDQGAGAAYPETYADTQITRTVLSELAPLITARDPKLLPTADAQLDTLQAALQDAHQGDEWETLGTASLAERQKVDAAIGSLLETLSAVPDMLEVPPTH